MPAPQATLRTRKPTGRIVLVWLTLAVALVHLALLQGLPDLLSAWHSEGDAPSASFSTRTLPPELPAPPKPQPARSASKAPANRPAVQKPAPPPAPPSAQPPQAEPPSNPAPAAPESPAAADNGATGATDAASAQGSPAADSAPSSPPATAASAPAANVAGAKPPPPAEPPRTIAMPPSIRLLYDVKGVVTYAYTGGSELLWLNQGDGYNARLQITKFGFNLRTWTSRGELTKEGLAPLRFGDKTRSEIASHFQRDKGIVSFSANTPDSPLQPGAQDYLSSFFQLAGMLAGEPQRYPAGSLIAFQVVNARSAEPWVFRVDGPESVELPDGPKAGIKLTREHDVQYDTKVELWLAPDLFYVPIRIRLSQGNGDFAELLWRSAQKPE